MDSIMHSGRKLLLSLFALAQPVLMGSWQSPEHHRIQRVDPDPADYFGKVVCLDGDWLAVSTLALQSSNGAGKIMFYERAPDGWTLAQVLESPPDPGDPNSQREFGSSMAMDNGRVLVTAPEANQGDGVVFVIERQAGQWQIVDSIESPNPDPIEAFGSSLDIHGDVAVVSGAGSNAVSHQGGALYVFELQGSQWVHTDTLHPEQEWTIDWSGQSLQDATVYHWRFRELFGWKVALHDGLIAASCHLKTSEQVPSNGTQVIVFENQSGQWVQSQVLTPSNPTNIDRFGLEAIAVDSQQILIGVGGPTHPTLFGNVTPGRVEVFERGQGGTGPWVRVQEFEASDASTNSIPTVGIRSDGFGEGHALVGDRLLVGAPRAKRNHGSGSSVVGQCYLFERDGQGVWSESEILQHSDWDQTGPGQLPPTGFGSAVALSDQYGVVGNPLAWWGNTFPNAGATYIFEQDFGVPYSDSQCDQTPHSLGLVPRVEVTGSLVPSDGILTAWLQDGIAGAIALMLTSQSTGLIENPAGSLGDLCLGAPWARLGVELADSSGKARFAVDPQAIPLTPPQTILSGQTWYFQAFYRDLAITGLAYTSGVSSVTFP